MQTQEELFARIVADVVDGVATDADVAELNAMFDENPQWLEKYVDQCDAHYLLQWRLTPATGVPQIESIELPEAVVASRRNNPLWLSRVAAGVAIAATAAIAFWLGTWWIATTKLIATVNLIATVTRLDDVEWADGNQESQHGSRLTPGTIAASAGTCELTLDSGVVVACEAPFELELVDPMRINLVTGRLRAKVPPHAKGFAIDTRDSWLVDQGTEFGVDASKQGGTSVFVFDGKVDVQAKSHHKQTAIRRLLRGEALRMMVNESSMERVMQIVSEDSRLGWSTDSSDSLISVADNIRGPDSLKYYEVVPRGFAEDVMAFVDRPYEWNGINNRGLPPMLRGADYVKTFIDDRHASTIRITLTIMEPVDLFVFLDDRAAPPEWLLRDFEDTGEKIGLDEKPTEFYPGGDRLGVGPGDSVDQIYHVWRRQLQEPGMVALGAISGSSGRGGGRRSMYGIAARRLPVDASVAP